MRTNKTLLAAAVVILASFASPAANAQSDADKAMARTLGQQGAEALQAKDYPKALELFTRANKIFHAPTLQLGLARSLAGSGKLVAALEAYNTLVREGPGSNASAAFTTAVDEGTAEKAKLEPRIGKVVLTVKGPSDPAITAITLDGEGVPLASLGVERPIDPGQHTASVTAKGFNRAEQTFTVEEGKGANVALTLTPAATGGGDDAAKPLAGDQKPSSTRKTVGYIGIGVGGASLVAGIITGVVAMGARSKLSDDCKDNHCPDADSGTLDSFRTMGTVSTITFIAGGVLAAGGVVLVLTAPKAPTATAVNPFVGPGYAGIRGSF